MPSKEVGWVGLEPTTNALKGRCSTIELPTRRSSEPKKLGSGASRGKRNSIQPRIPALYQVGEISGRRETRASL